MKPNSTRRLLGSFLPAFAGAVVCAAMAAPQARAWEPKKAPIMTQWAALVDPKDPLPEYPRPQLTRAQWQNLNGIWQYQPGNSGDAAPFGKTLGSEILVPFPVESALSGVMEHHDRLWYRRTFNVPAAWKGKQLMLNFGAVDYEAQVFVNGQSVGTHTGGYEQFSYDISPYLKAGGPQELIVRVFDPTEKGGQPRGKQTTNPGGIMYTPTTGIWQTVWLEPVAKTSIANLHMVPDIDKRVVKVTVNALGAAPQTRAMVTIRDGAKVVKTVSVKPGVETSIAVPNAKLWSPTTPFLYSVNVKLMPDGKTVSDSVGSYFGMRKISVGMAGGFNRLLLNNKFVFQMGPLDQGFWPDGLYTAPTDAALASDIVMMKRLGFNMARKHIKVEPARWYYHADKLGLMVWQDMPSGNSYIGNPPPLDKPAFEKQLRNVIPAHWNSPAIVMWVIFNENQGYHDAARLVGIAKSLDPSRLVSRNSGLDSREDLAISDIVDVHNYPPPAAAPISSVGQAMVCGEYGGVGYAIPGHLWKGEGWGYVSVPTREDLQDTYGEFTGMLKDFRDNRGLSAAVYTEITDVEIEINGLMTYDRVLKVDPARIALANRFAYPLPTYQEVVPTSQKTPLLWRYSFDLPAGNWTSINFDDSTWKSGRGAFGTPDTPGLDPVGTLWNTPDIWLRRTAPIGELSDVIRSQLLLRALHDEDIEVYINGVLAVSKTGFVGNYSYLPISAAAKAALIPNGPNLIAVHCHQTQGGQSLDVGISRKIPAVETGG